MITLNVVADIEYGLLEQTEAGVTAIALSLSGSALEK